MLTRIGSSSQKKDRGEKNAGRIGNTPPLVKQFFREGACRADAVAQTAVGKTPCAVLLAPTADAPLYVRNPDSRAVENLGSVGCAPPCETKRMCSYRIYPVPFV
jgi:hypothetical protein